MVYKRTVKGTLRSASWDEVVVEWGDLNHPSRLAPNSSRTVVYRREKMV